MNIFFDHNLSYRLAHALSALLSDTHCIVALRDKFPLDISDTEFIAELSREGRWIVISGDYRITRTKAERQAFQQSRLTGFFMAPGLKKSPVLKQLERLCALWDTITTVAGAAEPGALFELPVRSTRVRQLKLRALPRIAASRQTRNWLGTVRPLTLVNGGARQPMRNLDRCVPVAAEAIGRNGSPSQVTSDDGRTRG